MVQRAEEQDCISTVIRPVDVSSVCHRATRNRVLCLISRGRQRLFDVMSYWIKKMDCVTASSEPESMDASSAADVEDRCGRCGEMSLQDVLGTISLELASTVKQSLGLLDLPIMFEHLRGK